MITRSYIDAEFVDPAQIPVPGGRSVQIGEILAAHEDTNAAYRLATVRAEAARRGIDLNAAADLLGPAVIEVPRYESQILDMTRGRGVLGQRARRVPATGQPTRYFEQRTVVDGTFIDPRQISVTGGTHHRGERSAVVKCIGAGFNVSMFDAEVTRDQGLFNQLLADDVQRTVKGVLRASDKALWRGTDTDVAVPTTLQYVGGITQINRTFLVPSTANAIDAICTEVASLTASDDFEVRPSAIYAHPMTVNQIVQEERQNHRQVSQIVSGIPVMDRNNNVIAGLQVVGLATAAGIIPIISDWALPAPVTPSATEGAGHTDYTLAILTEEAVEIHYVGSEIPRLFALGLTGNLATQYVCVLYDCPIFKGKADVANTPETNAISYCHSVGTIVR